MDSFVSIRAQILVVELFVEQQAYVAGRAERAQHQLVYAHDYVHRRKAQKQLRSYTKQRNKLQCQTEQETQRLMLMIEAGTTTTISAEQVLRQAKRMLLQPQAASHSGLQILLQPRDNPAGTN